MSFPVKLFASFSVVALFASIVLFISAGTDVCDSRMWVPVTSDTPGVCNALSESGIVPITDDCTQCAHACDRLFCDSQTARRRLSSAETSMTLMHTQDSSISIYRENVQNAIVDVKLEDLINDWYCYLGRAGFPASEDPFPTASWGPLLGGNLFMRDFFLTPGSNAWSPLKEMYTTFITEPTDGIQKYAPACQDLHILLKHQGWKAK